MPWGQGRQPDKPGTYRIRPKDGRFRLSNVRADGTRVRMPGLSETEATDMAARLFPKTAAAVATIKQATQEWSATDDWGFPVRVSDNTIASVAQTLNIPDPNAPAPPVVTKDEPTREEIEKKERRAKNAKSLMDLAGVAGAAGDVFIARRMCEAAGKEPVKPDPKQVNDLRDSIKDMLTEWFGDREVSPWQMVILLGLGIPISMLIQSPRKKVAPNPADAGKPDLKSVP